MVPQELVELHAGQEGARPAEARDRLGGEGGRLHPRAGDASGREGPSELLEDGREEVEVVGRDAVVDEVRAAAGLPARTERAGRRQVCAREVVDVHVVRQRLAVTDQRDEASSERLTHHPRQVLWVAGAVDPARAQRAGAELVRVRVQDQGFGGRLGGRVEVVGLRRVGRALVAAGIGPVDDDVHRAGVHEARRAGGTRDREEGAGALDVDSPHVPPKSR